MADPIVWGELPKAQDDPQTITEAIAAAIAAHEADPDAHLGDGESLESHRSNEIIDHPAGSTLADKWTMSQLDFTTTIDVLDNFPTGGSVVALFPGVVINPTTTGSGGLSELVVPMEERNIFVDLSKEMLFQFIFNADTFYNTHYVINFGWTYGALELNGIGLELDSTHKRFYVTEVGGGSPVYLNWPSFTDLQTYIVRIHNVPDEGVINVYINGELLGTLTPPDPDASDASAGKIGVQRASLSGDGLNFLSLYFALEPQ